MAYKQPRVPLMKDGAKLAEYIRELVLFLKDFCLETWMAIMQIQKTSGEGAVTSVNGKTGEVELTARDVAFLGLNPIGNVEEDTSVNWAALGTGYCRYNTAGLLNGQPSRYGILNNYASSGDVFQIWKCMASGEMYIRSGNASGWADDWREMYDSANRPIPTASELLDVVYPVGSIYMSVNSLSPAGLFGGTWEQITDRFLLAAGSSYTAGSTGGEATHTLTTQEMPAHAHTITTKYTKSQTASYTVMGVQDYNKAEWWYTSSAETASSGSGEAHNNMPPYLAVYMWKRTA